MVRKDAHGSVLSCLSTSVTNSEQKYDFRCCWSCMPKVGIQEVKADEVSYGFPRFWSAKVHILSISLAGYSMHSMFSFLS